MLDAPADASATTSIAACTPKRYDVEVATWGRRGFALDGTAAFVTSPHALVRVDKDTGVKELAMKSLGLIGDARPAQLYIEAIPIRPLRVYAMEALAKVKDVEVLRPYKELFDRLRTDRDGLVAYNSGLIADKLEALDGTPVGSQGGQDDDE